MRRGVIWVAIAVAMIAVAMIVVAGGASALEAPGRPAFKPPPPAGFTARHEVPPGLHVLSPADIERYRRIFALQEAGQWHMADREISRVNNQVLIGHIQFQRYMPVSASCRPG